MTTRDRARMIAIRIASRPRFRLFHPEAGFLGRFALRLAERPVRLVVACLATVALAPAMVVGNAAPRQTAVAAPLATRELSPQPLLLEPGHRQAWFAEAEKAAASCPGLPAEVLVAVGEIESGLGLRTGMSTAGAVGPMQFLPATWSAYGSDGDGDGSADIMNPRDALYGAAALLCANGGGEPGHLRSALWNYNHSDDYVNGVLQRAGLAEQ